MAAAHEVEQGAVVTVNWGHLPAGAGNKLSVDRQLCQRAEQCLGMDLIWRKTKAQATTSGLNPQPAYLALAAAFCATSSPQLNHGRVDLNEVLSAWCALCRDS